MSIIIFGGDGWIGNMIYDYVRGKGVDIEKAPMRLDKTEEVREYLKEKRPEKVICTIGRTSGVVDGEKVNNIDYLEYPGKLVENLRDNLYGPVSCALICKEMGIHFTYMGTGCIFTYNEEERLFREDMDPNFFGSSYSVVKGYSDRIMRQLGNVLNVRIRMPISDKLSERDFTTKILKYKKICSIPNSMTILSDMIPILYNEMMEGKTGTLHLVNPGVIEHKEILDMYEEIFGIKLDYKLVEYNELIKGLKSERSNCELDATYIRDKYGVRDIKEGMRGVLEGIKREYDNREKTVGVIIYVYMEELVPLVNYWIEVIDGGKIKSNIYLVIDSELSEKICEKLNYKLGMKVMNSSKIGGKIKGFLCGLNKTHGEDYIVNLHTIPELGYSKELTQFVSSVDEWNRTLDRMFIFNEDVICNSKREVIDLVKGEYNVLYNKEINMNGSYINLFSRAIGIGKLDKMEVYKGLTFVVKREKLNKIIENYDLVYNNLTQLDELSPIWYALEYKISSSEIMKHVEMNPKLPKNMYENPYCWTKDGTKESAWERIIGYLVASRKTI